MAPAFLLWPFREVLPCWGFIHLRGWADGLGLVVADGDGFFYRWMGGVAEKEGVGQETGIGYIPPIPFPVSPPPLIHSEYPPQQAPPQGGRRKTGGLFSVKPPKML